MVMRFSDFYGGCYLACRAAGAQIVSQAWCWPRSRLPVAQYLSESEPCPAAVPGPGSHLGRGFAGIAPVLSPSCPARGAKLFQFGMASCAVQRPCNTRFEFGRSGKACLDKTAISKHPSD